MMTNTKKLIGIIAAFCILTPAMATVKLPAVFGDGMVIQRDKPICVWGWASPEEKITLEWKDTRTETKADGNGTWQVELPASEAGGPYTMKVNSLTVRDILVGDVFLCSGQSNMELPVRRVMDMFADEILRDESAMIRHYTTPKVYNIASKQDDTNEAQWKHMTNPDLMEFSALAYFYAKELHRRTGIPVGIVNSSWGGTPIQAWMSRESLKDYPHYLNAQEFYADPEFCRTIREAEQAEGRKWREILQKNDPGYAEDVPWYSENMDDSSWKEVDMFSKEWGNDGMNPIPGSHWLRKEIEVPRSMTGKEAVLRVGCIVDSDIAYINGVKVGSTGYQYPPRIYSVPKGVLKAGKNTVTLRITSNGGQPSFVKEKPYMLISGRDTVSIEGTWRYRTGARMPKAPGSTGLHNIPTGLYNAMIHPLKNMKFNGVLWYQGESNVGRRNEYADLLCKMMKDWRKTFNDDELHFYIIELADYMHKSNSWGRKSWAEMRDRQAEGVNMSSNATLIKNSDLGEWNDIHPLDKKTLAHRIVDETMKSRRSLKEAFKNHFMIGSSMNTAEITGRDREGVAVIKKHFNTIVAENCMKSSVINPEEGVYDFALADKFVEFGEANDMFIVGHCLVWHSQLAKWIPYDKNGRYVTPEVLKARMKESITAIVSRYRGRVDGWDVVNEAITEDGSYRENPYYEILGKEYIELAFRYAHEADPDAELYLNDYGMNGPQKREGYVRLIKELKSKGIRVDAVGMQAHIGLTYPDVNEFEESIEAFAGTGCKVMITEWDLSALPTVTNSADVSITEQYNEVYDPYRNGLSPKRSARWNARMKTFMDIFIRHSDAITRVNAWGVSDDDSWKNHWPIEGRTDYPLLFDRKMQPKPFLTEYLSGN